MSENNNDYPENVGGSGFGGTSPSGDETFGTDSAGVGVPVNGGAESGQVAPGGDGGAGGTGSSPTAPEGISPGDTGSVASTGESAGSGLSGLGSSALGVGMGMASLVARGGKNAGRAMMRMFSGVGAKLMAAGGGISTATGGFLTPIAGAAVTGGGVGVAALTTGALLFNVVQGPAGQRDDAIMRCYDEAMQNTPAGSNASGNAGGPAADKAQEEEAEKIYGILSYAGMGDENIAGVLGNFQSESGIDPTAVENIATEQYTIGPLKQAFIDAGYEPQPTGIGLGQWTWERTHNLVSFAKDQGEDWWQTEVQLAYAMSDDSAAPVFNSMVDNSSPGSDNPESAAKFFLEKWEIPQDIPSQTPIRQEQASQWYAKMGGWSEDADLGESVLAMAETSKKSANNKAVQQELNDCLEKAGGSAGGGNEDAATAMATYAWAYQDWGNGNDGTELYQYLMGEIFPGDPYFQSCDRGVATAVRWSGTDDTFPVGPTSVQYQYFVGEGSEKWEEVDGIDQESNMKAGDVLVTKGDGHIQMYLGEEVVQDVWGSTPHEEDATMASASYMERSPGLQHWDGYITDSRPYSGWRSKGGESESKYTDIKIPSGMKDGPSSTK